MFALGRSLPAVVAALVVAFALAAPLASPHESGARADAGAGWSAPPLSIAASSAASAPVRSPTLSPSPLLDPRWANWTMPGVAAPPAGPATMVYDGHDGYVVWYGLAAPGVPGGATWSFASGTWVNRTATAGPGPAGATWGTSAYDATDGYVLWYGGTDAPASSTTWQFSAGKWTNLTAGLTARPSPARAFASAAFDPAIGAAVLFGGWDGAAYLNDTWAFAHGAWTAVPSPSSPAPRVSAGLAYDGSDGYLLLAGGGTSSGPAADTWSFNGTSWTAVLATGGPVGIGGAQGLTAAPGGGVLGFGGAGCVQPLQGPCNLTYEFSAGAWQRLPPGGAPSARVGLQLTYDANDATVIAWGGAVASGGFLNDTWAAGGPVHLIVAASPNLVAPDGRSDFVARAGGGYGNYSFTWTGTPPDCPLVNSSDMECESEIPGNYTVAGHLLDTAGNATTALAAFEVLHALTSELVITPPFIDVGQTATLRVVISGGDQVVNFTWVGLPTGCSKANWSEVNCTPTNPGYFSVEVTTTDRLGDVTASPDLALVVNALPTVGIWSNASSGTAPCSVQFFSSVFGGSPAYAFLWTFGDGATATGPDPVHAYSVSGVYAVGVTVTDAVGGAVGSVNLTIDVLNPLLIQPQASSAYPATGQAVTFSAVISGGGAPYTYSWTFGDGASSNAASATHAFATAGTHTVVLVVSDSHGLTSIGSVVVDVQGGGAAGAGPASLLSSPWVAGLIGAALGIAVTALAIRPAAPPPGSADSRPRAEGRVERNGEAAGAPTPPSETDPPTE